MKAVKATLFILWHLLIIVWQFWFMLTANGNSIDWSEKVISPLIVILFLFLFLFFLEFKTKIKKQKALIIELLLLFVSFLFMFVSKLGGISFG